MRCPLDVQLKVGRAKRVAAAEGRLVSHHDKEWSHRLWIKKKKSGISKPKCSPSCRRERGRA